MRFGITCEPPMTRELRQRSGSKRLSTLPAPAIVRRPSSREKVCAGFGEEPAGEKRAQEVAGELVADFRAEPGLEGERVERLGVAMRPRGRGVDVGGELVELRHAVGVRALRCGAEWCVVRRVAARGAVSTDVHVLALAEAREQLDFELGEKCVHGRVVRGDPLPAELVRLAADLGVPDAAADAVARLEHDHLATGCDERARRRQPGDAGTDDCDVGLDLARAHAPIIAQELTVRSGRMLPCRALEPFDGGSLEARVSDVTSVERERSIQ